MALFLSMLPIYLFGNFHCIGMCGPLVMMIGAHRYRYLYFFGRACAFSLAGGIAGEAGSVLNVLLRLYHIPAAASFLFGGIILFLGVCSLSGRAVPGVQLLGKRLSRVSQSLSVLMLRDQPLATFLFGFFTVALPCGQTLVVFSACALSGDFWVGLFNGGIFAILTSPSLWFAMHAPRLLGRAKLHYNTFMGAGAILAGALAICRGAAEIGVLPHMVLNPGAAPEMHLVIF